MTKNDSNFKNFYKKKVIFKKFHDGSFHLKIYVFLTIKINKYKNSQSKIFLRIKSLRN